MKLYKDFANMLGYILLVIWDLSFYGSRYCYMDCFAW